MSGQVSRGSAGEYQADDDAYNRSDILVLPTPGSLETINFEFFSLRTKLPR